ncbi:uncharacterized protein BX664DRAFT_54763 [Halteromyces radiatus]|uniref:uncharacterized protein n=1 Tax=Halteromyces radiatus TaxID=101107 RepID=UPI002221151E|nr:uncharacterized protein BX664DRAFT_54763 [Halteromyces radiatus]KAI8096210.1 hypothetical protein BX664DRAFT_54763 [Halteromyces radiatus]
MGPKTYTDFIVIRQQQQQNSNHQIVTPSTQILLWLHALDVDPYAGPYQCIHQQSLAWLLRFFQFPLVMPYVFYTTLLFVLSFLCFPWFQADFIPSSNGYGTFYLWGIVFDGEWLPLGDTWMFATFHLCFDVGVFLILFAWRVTDVEDLHCSSTSEKHRQQWNQTLWFKVMEVLYWLWRMRSVMALGSFYGGLWPTLMMNLLVLWMLFVAGVLIWGKDGWIHKKNKTRIQMVLDGCDSCLDRSGPTRLDVNYEQQQQQEQQQVDSFNVSITSTSTMKNNPDDDWLEEQTSSESSSSSATTMDRNRIKVRRKGNGENNKR